jgi:hypothetical protein
MKMITAVGADLEQAAKEMIRRVPDEACMLCMV